jgi:multiple sugar transport system permease protein
MRGWRKYVLFAALVAPILLLRGFGAAYPIADTIRLSFTNLSVLGGTNEYVGLENFRELWDDYVVREAVRFTAVFVLLSTLLELVLGLVVALLLNASFRGRRVARAINLIPWAIPTIVAAYAFQWILDDQFGLVPNLVDAVSGVQILPLVGATEAQISLILVNVWKNTPFIAIVFLAGLQGVPEELYEAAKVDGASAWQRFRGVTVPMMLPLIVVMGMFFVVWQLASFDLIFGLTAGGPGNATTVLSLRIFQEGLQFFEFGMAAALSVVLLLMVAIVGLVGVVLFRRVEVRL